jgi:hypothetical protein
LCHSVRLRLGQAAQLCEVALLDHIVETDRFRLAFANRAERVAQAIVDGERTACESFGEGSVVDEKALVYLFGPAVAVRLVRETVNAGWRDAARDHRGPTPPVLLLALLHGANRKMKHVDGIPAVQRTQGRLDRMAAVVERDIPIGAVCDERPRAERIVLLEARIADPDRHPLCEEVGDFRSRDEVAHHGVHAPKLWRDSREDLLQRPAARPPELIRVGADDPVGTVVRRGETRHLRDPLTLLEVIEVRLLNQVQHAVGGVRLEDVRCAVGGAVVHCDDEVDAGVQVKRQHRVDNVRLIAEEECHHHLHGDLRTRRLKCR